MKIERSGKHLQKVNTSNKKLNSFLVTALPEAIKLEGAGDSLTMEIRHQILLGQLKGAMSVGAPKKNVTAKVGEKTSAPKDGISDDMRAVMDDLRKPQSESSQAEPKQEAQADVAVQKPLKKPQSPAMQEMLDNMESPSGSPRVMVNDKGLLTFDSTSNIEAKGLKSTEAKSELGLVGGNKDEPRHFEDIAKAALIGAFMGGMMNPGLIVGGAGLMGVTMLPFGVGFGLSTYGGKGGDTIQGTELNGGQGANAPEPIKKPRAGSDMAEMLENMRSPQKETALGVNSEGKVGLQSEPYLIS